MDDVMLHFPTAFHIESSNTPEYPKWLLMWFFRIIKVFNTKEEAQKYLGDWLAQDVQKRS
jgi:hypothetical protein